MKIMKSLTALLCLTLAVAFASPALAATLKYGSTGEEVKTMQGNLIYMGYLDGRADGIFGAKTAAAVRLYQTCNSLYSDGLYGNATKRALTSEVLRVMKVVDTAKRYLGVPYTYGGTSPETGFDCSGFTRYVYRQAGITIPRVSYEQAAYGKAVKYAQLRAGDLVAFNSPVSHVGIYIGGGKFIHSPHTGDVVKITDLKYMDLTGIRRVTGAVLP